MRSLKSFIIIAVVLVFAAGIAFAQATADRPARGQGKGGGPNMEQMQERRKEMQAKVAEKFEKLSADIAAGKVTQEHKDKVLKMMQEQLARIDEQIKEMTERRAKVSDMISKLQSYTPPAKPEGAAAPAAATK